MRFLAMETMSKCLIRQFYKNLQELNGGAHASNSSVEETLHRLIVNDFIQANSSISLEDAMQIIGLDLASATLIMTELQTKGVIESEVSGAGINGRYIPTKKFNDYVRKTKDSQLEVLQANYSELHPDEYEELSTIIGDILLSLGTKNSMSFES